MPWDVDLPRSDWQKVAWELRREKLAGDTAIAERIEAAIDDRSLGHGGSVKLTFRDEDYLRSVFRSGLESGVKMPTAPGS